MQIKNKLVIYFLVLFLFPVHVYFVVTYFWRISSHFESDFYDDFSPNLFHGKIKSNRDKFISDSCLNLYAVLFVKVPISDIDNVVYNLSQFLHLSNELFHIDDSVMSCGLPVYFCNHVYKSECAAKTKLCNDYTKTLFSERYWPENIEILATLNVYNNISAIIHHEHNKATNIAITWETSQTSDCNNLNYERILSLISSYNRILEMGKLNHMTGCSSISWILLSVSSIPTDLTFIQTEIASITNVYGSTKLYKANRIKRSLSKSSKSYQPAATKATDVLRHSVILSKPTLSPSLASTLYQHPPRSTSSHHDLTHDTISLALAVDVKDAASTEHVNKMTSATSSIEIISTLQPSISSMFTFGSSFSSGSGSSGFGSGKTNKYLSSANMNAQSRYLITDTFVSSLIASQQASSQPSHQTHIPSLVSTNTTQHNVIKSIFDLFDETISSTTNQLITLSVSPHLKPVVSPNPSSISGTMIYSTLLQLSVPITHHSSTLLTTKPTNKTGKEESMKSPFITNKQTNIISSLSSRAWSIKHVLASTALSSVPVTTTSPITMQTSTSQAAGPKMITATAVIGKLFSIRVPLHWKTYLESNSAKVEISGDGNWLTFNPTYMSLVGVPLDGINTRKSYKLLIILRARQRVQWPGILMLNVTVIIKEFIKNPPYSVEVNSTIIHETVTSNPQSLAAYYAAVFILKIEKILPHVDAADLSITRINMAGSAAPNQHSLHVSWFMEKINSRTFLQHYQPLLIEPGSNSGTRELFFVLLPEFTLDGITVTKPTLKSNDGNPTQANDGGNMKLSVILPVSFIAGFMIVSSIILIVIHHHKRLAINGNGLVDRTFAKCRKPVCLAEEIEMDKFHPTKPRILAEDITDTERSSWNETIFSVSTQSLNSEGIVFVDRAEDVEASGSYSFVDGRFMPEDECTSIGSDTSTSSFAYDGMLLAKKAE